MPPAERDAQRRERLLEAALALYGSQGYAVTTITELCAAAGVATRSFYELYGSQEALLLAVYDRLVQEMSDLIAEALAEDRDDLAGWVRGGVAACVLPLLADERRARIVELEIVGVSKQIDQRTREVTQGFVAMLDDALERMFAAGRLRRFDPGLCTLVMVGGVTAALTDHLLAPASRRRSHGELVEELTRVWLRVLGV